MKTHQFVIFSQLQVNSYLFELQGKSTKYVSRNPQIVIEEELINEKLVFEDLEIIIIKLFGPIREKGFNQ